MLGPDPLTADLDLLGRHLAALSREHGVASHELEMGVVPDTCDAQTLAWWRSAYREYRRRARAAAGLSGS